MRTVLVLLLPLLLTLAACDAAYDGRPVAAPTGISAVHTNGDTRGGGADPIFSGRGASTTISRGTYR